MPVNHLLALLPSKKFVIVREPSVHTETEISESRIFNDIDFDIRGSYNEFILIVLRIF